jgi:predicted RNase H-like HicB family nuclease
MTLYSLYLESGPRRRKTMVHVLDLLGCIAQGPTTEAALEAIPAAIRAYLHFLRRHGEAVDAESAFTTVVAEHVMEGVWLGNGDPTPGFGPDFQALAVEDLSLYLRRLDWLHADLLEIVRGLPRDQIVAEPDSGGRSIYRLLEHVAESHGVYLRYLVGKVDGLTEALRATQQGPDGVHAALHRSVAGVPLAFGDADRNRAQPESLPRAGNLDGPPSASPHVGALVGAPS